MLKDASLSQFPKTDRKPKPNTIKIFNGNFKYFFLDFYFMNILITVIGLESYVFMYFSRPPEFLIFQVKNKNTQPIHKFL